MKFIRCPACGKEVEAAAAVCPFCGHELKTDQQERLKWARRQMKVGLLCAGILLFLGIIIFSHTSSSRGKETAKLPQEEKSAAVFIPSTTNTPRDTPLPVLTKVPTSVPSTKAPALSSGGSSDTLREGEYWCMGKNDTCKNKTHDPFDFYCSSCDKNNNNIEDRFE